MTGPYVPQQCEVCEQYVNTCEDCGLCVDCGDCEETE